MSYPYIDIDACEWKRYVCGDLYTMTKFVIMTELSENLLTKLHNDVVYFLATCKLKLLYVNL